MSMTLQTPEEKHIQRLKNWAMFAERKTKSLKKEIEEDEQALLNKKDYKARLDEELEAVEYAVKILEENRK
jgi:hypothetical protein